MSTDQQQQQKHNGDGGRGLWGGGGGGYSDIVVLKVVADGKEEDNMAKCANRTGQGKRHGSKLAASILRKNQNTNTDEENKKK